jgi:hypothetical protein
MNTRERWSRILIVVGSIAMLVGAIDPMEGSLVILPGSGLVALGTFLSQNEHRLITYRLWVFILIAVGVGALFGLSTIGGIGGTSGHSMWWGVLVLPYLVGWSMGIWGPGVPRWVPLLGIVVGLWYLAIPVMALTRSSLSKPLWAAPLIVVGAVGVLTIGGCICRLRSRATEQKQEAFPS